MDHFFYSLIFGGGFVIAFILLIIASCNSDRYAKIVFAVLAFIVLALQGGCWKILAGIGRATGGGQGSDWLDAVIFAFIIAGVWSLSIINNKNKSEQQESLIQSNHEVAKPKHGHKGTIWFCVLLLFIAFVIYINNDW